MKLRDFENRPVGQMTLHLEFQTWDMRPIIHIAVGKRQSQDGSSQPALARSMVTYPACGWASYARGLGCAGHCNLRGWRQHRFAGLHTCEENFSLHSVLTSFVSNSACCFVFPPCVAVKSVAPSLVCQQPGAF